MTDGQADRLTNNGQSDPYVVLRFAKKWAEGDANAKDCMISDWYYLRNCDLFVQRCDSFIMKPEKKTLIPYIYNASNKDFLKFSEKSYKFKILAVKGT